MKKHLLKRLLSVVLVVVLCMSFALPAAATGTTGDSKVHFEKVDNSAVTAELPGREVVQEPEKPSLYSDTDTVRVSIVLSDKSTIEEVGTTKDLVANARAMSYRSDLAEKQNSVERLISAKIGGRLDVVWNMTLAANIISANVEYGQIEMIEKVPGVEQVLIETRYEPAVVNQELADNPNMATSSAQIGSTAAWAAGYTGAGSKVAVIDTGIDTDHQSFAASGYEYSLAHQAGLAGKTVEEYKTGLNLLDTAKVEKIWNQLHASEFGGVTAAGTYVSSKIPFAVNYVDEDLDVTHDNDSQGEHGSHVEGIAAANAYIPQGDSFVSALETVKVQGVAPDAQIIAMKVFGKAGGAYDSDYMVAIEDAILLGADSINLSLGSAAPGVSKSATAQYQSIMDSLTQCGAVVAMSAANSGSWVDNANNAGYLYSDDVNLDTVGSPGSYTNSLAVASVNNDGITGNYLTVGDSNIFYTETTGYSNAPMTTIAGEQEYILIDGFGTEEDWAAVGDALEGKVAACSRGSTSFYQKGDAAAEAGAIATIIYNNQPGTINMDLTDYSHDAPCVSVTQVEGTILKANATPVTNEAGEVLYYTGKMTIQKTIGSTQFNSEYYTMSDFSSWGVPGSLQMKPEITAPGGNIYSVNGAIAGGTSYENMSGTSMASPQVAGMVALVAQYIRENNLTEKTGLTARQLAQSLLMSTAEPLFEDYGVGEDGTDYGDGYYSVLKQGAGLANVGAAVSADSYILMGEDATISAADGKVKAELGDDPAKDGKYTVAFSINNLTDEALVYDLAADLFTQDVFPYYVNNDGDIGDYMDFWTAPLNANITWTVDGKTVTPDGSSLANLDFNGDGIVNNDDCTALLDYVTDKRASISNADAADLDEDGDIDSYDAYLFLNRVSSGAVTVPANGKVNVTVTMELTEDQKAALNENYPTGAYVEGYIYAKSVASAEGAIGTSHSIPVLGFYGNWTDPSMFDVGTYAEYATGDEVRIPYLGNPKGNSAIVTYAGDSDGYYFGGNPLVPDETYMPERNAINSVNGDQISKMSFIAIRNAAATRFLAVNETTGEVMAEAYPGSITGAFYYENAGTWQQTGYTLNTKFAPEGAAEGDQLKVQLTLAPEYYVDAEGNVDWDALGEGASLTVPMVVDNTAPELLGVSVSLTGNTMTVTAKDNQYVAAVALFNKAGTQAYTACGAAQDVEPDATVNYTMSLEGVNGKKFLLQVFDYAMNVTTYEINMQIGEEVPLPEMIAFDLDNNFWTTFTKESTDADIAAYANTDKTFFAASIVDHIVFASTNEGDLYVMPEDDLTDETLVGNMGAVLTDMAYNKADGKLYGVATGYLVTVDKLTGELDIVGEIGVETNTLACDVNGTFYCNKYGTGEVYSFTLDTIAEPELLVETDLPATQYVQTMEVNPNTGMLCWNSYYVASFLGMTFGFSYYYEINTTTGEATQYNDLWDEMSCLIIPEKTSGGDWTTPTDTISGVQVSKDSLTMLRGSTEQLVATVQPWTATDRTVTWTSSDAAVATVSDKGVITAVNAGECTITATSNLDPTKSASCTVTVETLKVTLHGMLQDKEGDLQTFGWNLETDETWTGGQKFNDVNVISAEKHNDSTAYAINGTGDGVMKLNLADGTSKSVGAAPVPVNDLARSEFSTEEQDLIDGIYYYYYLPAKDPAEITTSAFAFQSYLSQYTGGTEFVGVTTDGWTTYEDDEGNPVDAAVVYLLDNAGYIWMLKVYAAGDSYSCGISFIPSNLLDAGYEIAYDQDENPLSSLTVGADGNLYFSGFNGETNVIYRLSFDADAEGFVAKTVANVGSEVWPAILFEVTDNTANAEGAARNALGVAATVEAKSTKLTAEQMLAAASARTGACIASAATKVVDNSKKDSAAVPAEAVKAAPVTGSLNAVVTTGKSPVRPMSDTTVENNEDTIVLNVTAKDAAGNDVASTNGKMTVNYDSNVFELASVKMHAPYASYNDEAEGKVVLAYASVSEIPAGEYVATLTLTRKANGTGSITIDHEETGNTNPGYEENVTISYSPDADDHSQTELRGAVEPTLTKPGYTGDVVCVKCGTIVKKGSVIPALGSAVPVLPVLPGIGVIEELPFQDVTKSDSFYDDVRYVYEKGLMNGTSKGRFSPMSTLTRAMVVTILYRMEGEPTALYAGTFSDVADDQWYTDGVEWAAKCGVVNGYSNGKFGPEDPVTREQLVAILYRYAQYKGYSTAKSSALDSYADNANISAYAVPAMKWAEAMGILDAIGGKLLPRDNANRAQVATAIASFHLTYVG